MVFDALRSTRKSNRIAESVLLSQLQKWERYPVVQVEAAIRTYLEKDYAGQGKAEAYLLGIIRNQKAESKQSKQSAERRLNIGGGWRVARGEETLKGFQDLILFFPATRYPPPATYPLCLLKF